MTQDTDLKKIIDEAISGNVKISRLDVKVERLDTMVERLDVKVERLDTRVERLEGRADRTEENLRKLEAATSRHTEGLHRLEILFEERDKKIDFMLEILLDLRQRADDAEALKERVQNHDVRINNLELLAKKDSERRPPR